MKGTGVRGATVACCYLARSLLPSGAFVSLKEMTSFKLMFSFEIDMTCFDTGLALAILTVGRNLRRASKHIVNSRSFHVEAESGFKFHWSSDDSAVLGGGALPLYGRCVRWARVASFAALGSILHWKRQQNEYLALLPALPMHSNLGGSWAADGFFTRRYIFTRESVGGEPAY